MKDEQQLADAFWQMNRAILKINEILEGNPALADNAATDLGWDESPQSANY
jgi:hypothetical protein